MRQLIKKHLYIINYDFNIRDSNGHTHNKKTNTNTKCIKNEKKLILNFKCKTKRKKKIFI